MDEEHSPHSLNVCGNSYPTSSLESFSTNSSLSNEDLHELIPSADNPISNFQSLTNEWLESNSTPYTAAVDSLQLSPHNLSNHVSSTVSPLQYPILDMDPTPLPFTNSSTNDFQNFDDQIPMVSQLLHPNFPSISGKPKEVTSFHCPICNKNIVCYKGILKAVNKHLDTHLNVLCPICNCPFSGMMEFKNHILSCSKLEKVNKICSICKKLVPKKITKHMLRHVSKFKCPVPRCFAKISIANKVNHIATHLLSKGHNYYELSEKSPKSPKSPRSRNRGSRANKLRHADPYPRVDFSNEPNYLRNPVLYPTQQCNIQIDLSSTQKGDSMQNIGAEMPPFHNPPNSNALENSSAVEKTPKPHVGGWEKHTKGIGSKLMNMMGYVPGQGLGPRGEGILKPLEAVLLPKRTNLDRIMCMRAAGALPGNSNRGNAGNGGEHEEDLDRRITEKSEYLQELTNTILMHEKYLGLLQNLINETDKKFELLDEVIEISDEEDATSSEAKFIGPPCNSNVISDFSLVISSDDDI